MFKRKKRFYIIYHEILGIEMAERADRPSMEPFKKQRPARKGITADELSVRT